MKKFETIDSAVTDILSSIGDGEGRGYVQMSRIVLRTLDDLHYNIKPTVKSEIFEVLDNNTILYPSDSYKVVNAGRVLDNGCVMMLGKIYESQAKHPKTTCTCDACTGVSTITESTPDANVCSDCAFFNYYDRGVYRGELYGLIHDGFPYGRFYDNEEENRIEFTEKIRPGHRIILKYMTAVDKYTHDLVPVDMYSLIRHKALEQFYQASNPRKADMFRGYYRRDLRLLKQRENYHRLEDFIDAITSGYNNAVH